MKKLYLLALGLAIAATCYADGFPSRPRFQYVRIVGTPVDGQLQIQGAAAGASSVGYVQFRSSNAVDIGYIGDAAAGDQDIYVHATQATGNVKLESGASGAVLANGLAVVTQSNTNANGTIATGCTTTPALTLRWQVQGNVVFLAADSQTCTSNSGTKASNAGILPAAIRPTGTRECITTLIDNSIGVIQRLTITSAGTVTWVTPAATGTFSTVAGGVTSALCAYNVANI